MPIHDTSDVDGIMSRAVLQSQIEVWRATLDDGATCQVLRVQGQPGAVLCYTAKAVRVTVTDVRHPDDVRAFFGIATFAADVTFTRDVTTGQQLEHAQRPTGPRIAKLN